MQTLEGRYPTGILIVAMPTLLHPVTPLPQLEAFFPWLSEWRQAKRCITLPIKDV